MGRLHALAALAANATDKGPLGCLCIRRREALQPGKTCAGCPPELLAVLGSVWSAAGQRGGGGAPTPGAGAYAQRESGSLKPAGRAPGGRPPGGRARAARALGDWAAAERSGAPARPRCIERATNKRLGRCGIYCRFAWGRCGGGAGDGCETVEGGRNQKASNLPLGRPRRRALATAAAAQLAGRGAGAAGRPRAGCAAAQCSCCARPSPGAGGGGRRAPAAPQDAGRGATQSRRHVTSHERDVAALDRHLGRTSAEGAPRGQARRRAHRVTPRERKTTSHERDVAALD